MTDRFVRAAGFSLIELLIVVAIIAILAGIAYPTYISFVKKGNRADAKEALVNASQILERCYSQYYYYQATGTQTACPAPPTQSANNYYTINTKIPDPSQTTPQSYSITAAPVAGTLQAKDTQCTSFTLNSLGAQTATGTAGSTYCWTGHY